MRKAWRLAESGKWAGRLGWLALTIGPPSAVAGAWPGWAAGRPVVAGLLLVGYEGVLAIIAFAGGVTGDLVKRWRERLVTRLDQPLWRRLFRFDRRYREFVLGSLRFVDLKGLTTIGPYTPQLDEVFVDVGLAPRSPHQVAADPLGDVPAGVTERYQLWNFLDHPASRVLAVVGAAGSGKTTLLRYTARLVCRSGGRRRRAVPILLFLRDHAAEMIADPDVSLAELARRTLGRYRADEPAGWFEQKLRDGECVVLLDGLDEVARREDRRAVADWVERLIGQYPGNDFVITSRPRGYQSAEIAGATVLQVRRFTDEQVARFVRAWCSSVERYSAGSDLQEAERRAASAADDLLDRLRDSPWLYELTVNPLLLTMITNVHHYRGALPGSRAELYSEICEVMLWRRRGAKKLPIELGGDQTEFLLRRLAFDMMERRVRDLPKEEVVASIKPALRRVARGLSAAEFLTGVGSEGLLVERENGLYSFAHHTFQEYLAAAHIRDKGLTELLPGTVEDGWWRESTLLYAARSDSDAIIQACLASDSVHALALAFDCAEQAREIDPELRDRLDRLLRSAYEAGTEPRRRKLMADVLITRHLRRLIPAGTARICPQPITSDIYRLFLSDTGHDLPDDPRPFQPGSDAPVVGVRGTDALAFVGWVNDVVGGEPAYRLPTSAEIGDPAVQRALHPAEAERSAALSVWFDQNGSGPRLWTPGQGRHPYTVDTETLGERVGKDWADSAPTLARLLLIRSLVVLRALEFDLKRTVAGIRARNLAGELVHGLARAADLALAQVRDPGLAKALDPALAHAFDLARMVDLEVDHARALDLARLRDLARIRSVDLALALDLALARAFDAARGREWDRERVHDRDRAMVHDLDRALDRDREYARSLAETVDLDLDHALELDLELTLDAVLALDRARGIDRGPLPAPELDRHLEDIVGRALAHALSQALRDSRASRTGDGQRFQADFDRALAAVTGLASTEEIVSPDSLAHETWQGCAELTVGEGCSAWARDVAPRLERLAKPIFARRQPLTTAAATAIRIGALCLACEADTQGKPGTGAAFRRIAAGITLLEHRSTGRSVPTETIVLSTA
ncbi:NACHT domain-containing protein [Amycolatopsis sp. NPDC059021]|uniref:NACHT domain-containing protein n=1 Tax=Amycolatopsis sp. NPDC059021 TaxID=3346704 RepID=UPI00366DA432